MATDVAARGIDVQDITHVINYDVPGDARRLRPPCRAHRPRRRPGVGVTFVLDDQSRDVVKMAGDLGLHRELSAAGLSDGGATTPSRRPNRPQQRNRSGNRRRR